MTSSLCLGRGTSASQTRSSVDRAASSAFFAEEPASDASAPGSSRLLEAHPPLERVPPHTERVAPAAAEPRHADEVPLWLHQAAPATSSRAGTTRGPSAVWLVAAALVAIIAAGFYFVGRARFGGTESRAQDSATREWTETDLPSRAPAPPAIETRPPASATSQPVPDAKPPTEKARPARPSRTATGGAGRSRSGDDRPLARAIDPGRCGRDDRRHAPRHDSTRPARYGHRYLHRSGEPRRISTRRAPRVAQFGSALRLAGADACAGAVACCGGLDGQLWTWIDRSAVTSGGRYRVSR